MGSAAPPSRTWFSSLCHGEGTFSQQCPGIAGDAQTWPRCRGLLSLPPWLESHAPYSSKKYEIKPGRWHRVEGNHTPLSLGHQRSETAGQPLPGEVVLFSDALLAYFRGFPCVVARRGGSLRRAGPRLRAAVSQHGGLVRVPVFGRLPHQRRPQDLLA